MRQLNIYLNSVNYELCCRSSRVATTRLTGTRRCIQVSHLRKYAHLPGYRFTDRNQSFISTHLARSLQGRGAAEETATPKEIHDSLLTKAHNYYLDMERARSPTSKDNPINVFSGNYGQRSLLKGGSSVRSRSMRREIVPERNKE